MRPVLPAERRQLIADELRDRGSISVAVLEERYGVSPVTARRDLTELERLGIAERTHGGAVLPRHSRAEDSFARRLELATAGKRRLAEAVADRVVGPGDSIFVDSSTTAYFAARLLTTHGPECAIVTNSVPVLELGCHADVRAEVTGVGGALRTATRSLVGPQAVAGVCAHFTDHALISVRGVAEDRLTDPDALEAEVKRSMIAHARRAILLLDGSKLGYDALTVIAPLTDIDLVLLADAPPEAAERLAADGLRVETV